MAQTIITIQYDSEFKVTNFNFGSIKDSAEQRKIVSRALSFFQKPITRYKKNRFHYSNRHNTITIKTQGGEIQVIYGDPEMLNNFLVLTKVDLKLSGHKG